MRTVKVSFESNQQEVTIFPVQLQEYCMHFDIDINDEDGITDSFLKNETTTMVVNRQNVCVLFHH